MIRHLLPLLSIASACAGEFSVYLTPPELSENGKAIPMELVEGRQSIAYPCAAGGNIQFFRIAKDEKQTRTLVATTAVPPSAEQAPLVVSPGADGAYKIAPFWFSGEESKKGYGVFVNLNGRHAKLLHQSRVIVAGQFSSGQTLVPTYVEIYGQEDANSADLTRLIDRRVGIPQDDTGIYIILPKQQKYITLLSVEGSGLRDTIAKDALKKQLVPQTVGAAQSPPVG